MTRRVGVERKGNYLRLRLPRGVDTGCPRYFSPGIPDTPEGRLKAEAIALRVSEDILKGTFENWGGYVCDTGATQGDSGRPRSPLALKDIWDGWLEHKRPQVSPKTLQSYRECALACLRVGSEDPYRVSRGILERYSSRTARHYLEVFKASLVWAEATRRAPKGSVAKLQKPKRSPQILDIDPFSPGEVAEILKAFREHPRHSHYGSFVEFLFMTGCRTGEAIGLLWEDVAPDCGSVVFRKSYCSLTGSLKETKTGRSRRFPCSPRLQALLAAHPRGTSMVFPNKKGQHIDRNSFSQTVWKGDRQHQGILKDLIETGRVSRYRNLYQTRHTFITQALKKLPVSQVARLVGNTPEIIYRHYAANEIPADMPEVYVYDAMALLDPKKP